MGPDRQMANELLACSKALAAGITRVGTRGKEASHGPYLVNLIGMCRQLLSGPELGIAQWTLQVGRIIGQG